MNDKLIYNDRLLQDDDKSDYLSHQNKPLPKLKSKASILQEQIFANRLLTIKQRN